MAGLASGKLCASPDDFNDAMDDSDVVFVCVGTPPGPDGEADTTAIRGVARSIAHNLRHYHVIVTKSTVPIGTGYWLGSLIEDIVGPEGRELFGVVSNPEFLREGNAVQDFLHPDRVVLGSDDPKAREIAADVYRPILEQKIPGDVGKREVVPLLQTRLTTAEMIKYASNAFSGHQDQLRQRDRPPLRLRRRRHHRGDGGHGPRHPDRRPLPRCRPGLGRLVLRQGSLRPRSDGR